MTWNFRLELPEFNTAMFICDNSVIAIEGLSQGLHDFPPDWVNLASHLIRPFPARNIRFVCAMLVGVVPAPYLLIL